MSESHNWFNEDKTLGRIVQRQLGDAFERARPRLARMGERAANEAARWAEVADHQGPKLVVRNREGERIDEIDYHPSYRWLQEVAYGGGIVAATWDPALAKERGDHPRCLTFALGYLFGQAESGVFCPVCMTDGAAWLLHRYGSKELKDRFIPRLASTSLEKLYTGAMFLTEKEGGSDVGRVETVARPDGKVWRLSGEKWFCSNVDADVIMNLARPEGAAAGTKGLGLFVLPRTLENGKRNAFRIERIKDKLGVRSMPTGEVLLEGAEAYLLGGPGEGFKQMTEMLNLSRLYNSVASVAVMRRSLLEALAWSKTRVAFKKPVLEHPLLIEVAMDLACEQRAALHWVFRCIELTDLVHTGGATGQEQKLVRLMTPLLKYYTAKKAVWAASEAMEVLGGNGYIEDWPMARIFRDAQVLPIWEGTTNVLVLDAFRAIRKESAHEALLAELGALHPSADAAVAPQLKVLADELASTLVSLTRDPDAEHLLQDWTDRACLAWEVSLLASKKAGGGNPEDVRCAKRLLARHAGRSALRTDRASKEEVLQIAFG